MAAPIALYVYNSPFHTKFTISALANNVYAKDSELIIFSDGPKTEPDKVHVAEVRNFIALRGILDSGQFPISEEIHETTLSLPISFFHTEDDILKVIEIMNKF